MNVNIDNLKTVQLHWEKALVSHLVKQTKTLVNENLKEEGVGDKINNLVLFSEEIKEIVKGLECSLPRIVHVDLDNRQDVESFQRNFNINYIPETLYHALGSEIGKVGDAFRKHGAHWSPNFSSDYKTSKCIFMFAQDSTFFNVRFSDELKVYQRTLLDSLKLFLKENPKQTYHVSFD